MNEPRSVAQLLMPRSEFPGNVRRELLHSLRRRNLNPKFHYDSVKQVTKWLKLHRAYAPSQTEKECRATYQRAFKSVIGHYFNSIGTRLHLIGLGCGHGEKEASLLGLLARKRVKLSFTPVDVSVPLV